MKWEYRLSTSREWVPFENEDSTFDGAAREICQQVWEEEPCDPHYFEVEMEIRGENGLICRFECEAEADIHFYAYPLLAVTTQAEKIDEVKK